MMVNFWPIFLVLAAVIRLALFISFGSVPPLDDREVLGCLIGTTGGVRLVGDMATTSAGLVTGLTRLRGGENSPPRLLGIGGDIDCPLSLLLVGEGNCANEDLGNIGGAVFGTAGGVILATLRHISSACKAILNNS